MTPFPGPAIVSSTSVWITALPIRASPAPYGEIQLHTDRRLDITDLPTP
ncbi:hypothetical protein [Actinomadura sp. NPDC048394]